MKKFSVPVLFVFIALCLCGAGFAAEIPMEAYVNARFGFRIDVPSLFDSSVESDNGDGMTFGSAGGKYTLWVWGGHNILCDDGDSILEGLAETVKMIPGSANSGEGFYTLEFFDEDDKGFICHEYGIVTPDTVAAYRLRFPEEEHGSFASLTGRMDSSLTLGDESGPVSGEGFAVRDGRVFRNGREIEGAEFQPAESSLISGWTVLGPELTGMVSEEETGVYFFGPEGDFYGILPLESEYMIQEIAFCPENGERFVFENGSGSRADIFLEIYDAASMAKIAEYAGLRGSWAWIDPWRVVFTRIDDIRDEGFGYGFGYGLRLSVVMYDAAMKEEFVLMEATDTASFFFESVEGDRLVITKEWVNKVPDWNNESKRFEKKIRIEIPAAG